MADLRELISKEWNDGSYSANQMNEIADVLNLDYENMSMDDLNYLLDGELEDINIFTEDEVEQIALILGVKATESKAKEDVTNPDAKYKSDDPDHYGIDYPEDIYGKTADDWTTQANSKTDLGFSKYVGKKDLGNNPYYDLDDESKASEISDTEFAKIEDWISPAENDDDFDRGAMECELCGQTFEPNAREDSMYRHFRIYHPDKIESPVTFAHNLESKAKENMEDEAEVWWDSLPDSEKFINVKPQYEQEVLGMTARQFRDLKNDYSNDKGFDNIWSDILAEFSGRVYKAQGLDDEQEKHYGGDWDGNTSPEWSNTWYGSMVKDDLRTKSGNILNYESKAPEVLRLMRSQWDDIRGITEPTDDALRELESVATNYDLDNDTISRVEKAIEGREEDYERIKDLRLKVEVEANATNKEIEELGNLERKYGFESEDEIGSEDPFAIDWTTPDSTGYSRDEFGNTVKSHPSQYTQQGWDWEEKERKKSRGDVDFEDNLLDNPHFNFESLQKKYSMCNGCMDNALEKLLQESQMSDAMLSQAGGDFENYEEWESYALDNGVSQQEAIDSWEAVLAGDPAFNFESKANEDVTFGGVYDDNIEMLWQEWNSGSDATAPDPNIDPEGYMNNVNWWRFAESHGLTYEEASQKMKEEVGESKATEDGYSTARRIMKQQIRVMREEGDTDGADDLEWKLENGYYDYYGATSTQNPDLTESKASEMGTYIDLQRKAEQKWREMEEQERYLALRTIGLWDGDVNKGSSLVDVNSILGLPSNKRSALYDYIIDEFELLETFNTYESKSNEDSDLPAGWNQAQVDSFYDGGDIEEPNDDEAEQYDIMRDREDSKENTTGYVVFDEDGNTVEREMSEDDAIHHATRIKGFVQPEEDGGYLGEITFDARQPVYGQLVESEIEPMSPEELKKYKGKLGGDELGYSDDMKDYQAKKEQEEEEVEETGVSSDEYPQDRKDNTVNIPFTESQLLQKGNESYKVLENNASIRFE